MSFNTRTPNTTATHLRKYSSTAQLVDKARAGAIGIVNGVVYFKTLAGTAVALSPLATGRAVGQTAAVASVVSFTVGAVDGTFMVGGAVLVTASSSHAINVNAVYTDEGNTARTVPMLVIAPGSVSAFSIGNAQGTVPWSVGPFIIRCKAATTIKVSTSGSFGSVTYNVDAAVLRQIA